MPDSQDPKQVNNDLRNAQFGGGFINAENVNAGRIGGDIWNIFFEQQTTPVGNSARPKNERILLAAVKEEVTARLRQSLHNAVLINLGKESQPQQVKRPWDAEIKIGLKPAVPFPNTTTILEVFDSQEVAGKLLILGAPGSGKTTTQLELAQALVSRAEEQVDYPVPVLFNLSSWKDGRQPITDWLVAELKSKYGVSTKLGNEWVADHQLLPFLDGLDELEPQRQELCVCAINQFLAGETRPHHLVVCSRSEEYSNYTALLQLNGAIDLQPLTSSQICDYLTSINYLELWSTVSSDLDLLELVKTPLLLSITVLVSQEISVEEWQHLTSITDRLQYLLDAYVGRMLTRNVNSRAYLNHKNPNVRKTRMWLIWLAKQMLLEPKTEFLIEEMQPSLLKSKISQIIYNLIVWEIIQMLVFGLIFGLLGGLIGGVIGVQNSDLIFGLIGGVIFGLLGGLIFGLLGGLIFGLIGDKIKDRIEGIEIIKFSYYKYIKSLIIGLSIGLIIGLVGGLICGLIEALINKWVNQLIIWLLLGAGLGLILGLIGGMIGGLDFGFYSLEIENKIIPNQGIWQSAKNTVKLSALLFLPFTMLIFLIQLIIKNNNEVRDLIISLIFGLLFGLLVGIARSGTPVIKHFALRLVLYFNGYIPWNYARFLDYCTERMLLQRVGGRYRFIHRLLQDHFAQMEFRQD